MPFSAYNRLQAKVLATLTYATRRLLCVEVRCASGRDRRLHPVPYAYGSSAQRPTHE